MPSHDLVRRLAEEIRSVERAAKGTRRQPHFSTGIPPLDQLLPDGGLCSGMLVEWLPVAGEAVGGTSLWGLLTAKAACRPRGAGMQVPDPQSLREKVPNSPHSEFGPLVVVDRQGMFYPPAAAAWGVPPASMILVRPANARDEAWVLDQVLRSPAVAAVLAWPNELDGRAFRRLQLAVESSGTIGVLVRPASARQESTWADVRLGVGPLCQSGPGEAREPAAGRLPGPGSGPADRIDFPQDGGWRFSLHRLQARSSIYSRESVQVAITPEGRIQEVPAEGPPIPIHGRSAIAARRNLKSAV